MIVQFVDDVASVNAAKIDWLIYGFEFIQILLVTKIGKISKQWIVGRARDGKLVDSASIIYL